VQKIYKSLTSCLVSQFIHTRSLLPNDVFVEFGINLDFFKGLVVEEVADAWVKKKTFWLRKKEA